MKTSYLTDDIYECGKSLQPILEVSYINGSFFGTTDRSLRRITNTEKRVRDERFKQHFANLKITRVIAPLNIRDNLG